MTDGHGHGHVRPRADGAKARCGGPYYCEECRAEELELARAAGGDACPDCDGKGKRAIAVPLNDFEMGWDYFTCETCRGARVLSPLALAVRKGRGGPPPPAPQQGFA